MLSDLSIKNFAIIDNLHISFREGLNVLTGETGAGKSIIIGAIQLILGGRSSAEIIRTGEEEAVVEALFDLSGEEEISAGLAAKGIDVGQELLVKRVVSRTGRSRVYLNGGLASTTILSAVSPLLVNIYGQHESQSLLRPEQHLALLDSYGQLAPLYENFSTSFAGYCKTSAEIKRLEESESDERRRIDLLQFQSAEIAAAELQPEEEEDLLRERQLLVHADRLYNNSQSAFEALYAGERNIVGLLQHVRGKIAEIASIDGTVENMVETVENLCIQLEDAALSMRDYSAKVEADPHRLQQVDDRLDLISRLKKKYGPTVEDILAFKKITDIELVQLGNREHTRCELEKSLSELEERLSSSASMLSQARRKAAVTLKQAMEKELRQLAMKNAQFEVSFQVQPEPKSYGMERVEFLLSSNAGETAKPLSRIASGGELSRLMLALKQVHPESDVPTLVFDEVDTGIGGATSALVGQKLSRVARKQQVLCITHLPQVAAFADHHFLVEKKALGSRTVTEVTSLSGDDRISEMARMLGVRVTEKSLAHARELVEEATGGREC